jgi:hypothetical protein
MMFGTPMGSTFAFTFNVYDAIAGAIQGAVVELLAFVINMITLGPDPQLKAAWFRGEYGIILQISLYLLIPIIFAATIGALLHGGLQQVLRTYLWALPIGIFGGVVAIALLDIAIKIDQEITLAVFGIGQDGSVKDSASIRTVKSFYDQMNNSVKGDKALEADAIAWSVTQAICMLFMLVLLFFLMVEMYFRQVMIYMAALFIPFSLAAYIWGPIRPWFYSLCEISITMIFAKAVVAGIVSFGFTGMAYGLNGGASFSSFNLGLVFGALVILVIACMSGPVLVSFVMSPSHSILSFKAAKQVTPWNHDRKFAGQLFKANFDNLKGAFKGGGGGL